MTASKEEIMAILLPQGLEEEEQVQQQTAQMVHQDMVEKEYNWISLMNSIHTAVAVEVLASRLVQATAQAVLPEMEAKAEAVGVHQIEELTQAVQGEKTERTTVQTELQPPTHKQLLEALTGAQEGSSQVAAVEQVQVAEDKAEMAVLGL